MILGAGVTGLAAGLASGLPVYEAADGPGGICTSYYVRPGTTERLNRCPEDGAAYRFEIGGGHWIFGGSPDVLCFIERLSPTKRYTRRAAIRLAREGVDVPYPLQHHLDRLPPELAQRARVEMDGAGSSSPGAATMDGWLRATFGPTLHDLFFGPFHERYTAGLSRQIAPQDGYKSPRSPDGGRRPAPAGYNSVFLYPRQGLGDLVEAMAGRCRVVYGKRAVRIDVAGKEVLFSDGSTVTYQQLVSSVPLNEAVALAGLSLGGDPDPHTSVLVLNIGAERGAACPDVHWLYTPDSRSGFHRIGFYSNVDRSFLPAPSDGKTRVSLYVERAYPGGTRPTAGEVEAYTADVIDELTATGVIAATEAVDATWIDVAYTWACPGSTWREEALAALRSHGIHQVGRYGTWRFQGIADSIADGFAVAAAPHRT